MTASEPPTIKELKQTTPENWREVFALAADDSLHAIIDGGRVVASEIIQERARAELRRRESEGKQAEVSRAEKHAEKLTMRQVYWGLAGTVIGYLFGKFG